MRTPIVFDIEIDPSDSRSPEAYEFAQGALIDRLDVGGDDLSYEVDALATQLLVNGSPRWLGAVAEAERLMPGLAVFALQWDNMCYRAAAAHDLGVDDENLPF